MSHKPQPHLLLHNIIGAMSYWGTTTRTLLVGFVLGMAVLLHVTNAMSLDVTTGYAQSYFYVMACLFLLDAGYVTIARATPTTRPLVDKTFLLTALFVLAFIALTPYFVEVSNLLFRDVMVWLFAVIIFILSLRLVLGMVSARQ